jgi:DNA invertase Pin-like site-specific DNA recombinase
MNLAVRAIGYCRVSSQEQKDSGLGIAAQRSAVTAEIAHRGWELADLVVDEAESAKDLNRPGIRGVLQRLANGEADALVVSKLDRLTRSTLDLAELLVWADRTGVRLIVKDLGVDTSTSTGRLVAGIMGQVAEWEREQIAARTRDAAAERRKRGLKMGRDGVRDTDPQLAQRIQRERASGATWQAIADGLNRDGIATVRGGREWRVSSVQSAAGYIRPAAHARRVELPASSRRRSRQAAL